MNTTSAVTVKAVYSFIDSIAPFDKAMPWDNCGLLAGDFNSMVTGCVIALDCTKAVISYAKEKGANLIVTHHPVIFDPIKAVLADNVVFEAVSSGISIISAHTNLDVAKKGVNYCLANAIGLVDCVPFENEDNVGLIGRLGQLEKAEKAENPENAISADEFALWLKERLSTAKNAPAVAFCDCKRSIKTVAIVGGEGSDYLMDSRIADAFVTGEVKHHIYTHAQSSGIQLFTVGHYESEAVVLEPVCSYIKTEFPELFCITYNVSGVKRI